MQILFDLDGTLLDSKTRMFKLFQHLVPFSNLSFENYWDLKKNKINHRDILQKGFNYSPMDVERFESEWLAEIEQERWLAFDRPFVGVTEFLSSLRQKHILYLVTARQSEEKTLNQISSLGWNSIFEKVFITGLRGSKHLAIRSLQLEDTDWFVGDTGKDIQAGKALGLRTAGVLSGILNREKLLEYHPDIIVENVLLLNFNS